jgi:hypothetical protein
MLATDKKEQKPKRSKSVRNLPQDRRNMIFTLHNRQTQITDFRLTVVPINEYILTLQVSAEARQEPKGKKRTTFST